VTLLHLRITEKSGMGPVIAHLKRMGSAGNTILKRRFAAIPGVVVPQARAGAPVDDEDGGQLRDSIKGTPVSVRNGRVSVSVSAGGESLVPYLGHRRANVYAIVQETDHTLRHNNGHAGFLGKPWNAQVKKTMDEVRDDLDKEAANVGS
jgi:hypothetical protein